MVTANYKKPHMHSYTSTATGHNNGPKLACDNNEVHLVYRDAAACLWI